MTKTRVCDFPRLGKLISLMPRVTIEEVTFLGLERDACEYNSIVTFFLRRLYSQQT